MATWSPSFASPRDGDDGPRSQVTVPPSVWTLTDESESALTVPRAPTAVGVGGAARGGGEPVPSPSPFLSYSLRLVEALQPIPTCRPTLAGSYWLEVVGGDEPSRCRMLTSAKRLPCRTRETTLTRSQAARLWSEGDAWVTANVVTIELALRAETALADSDVITPWTL